MASRKVWMFDPSDLQETDDMATTLEDALFEAPEIIHAHHEFEAGDE